MLCFVDVIGNDTYGSIKGSLSGYWSVGPDARATLGVRVGGTEAPIPATA